MTVTANDPGSELPGDFVAPELSRRRFLRRVCAVSAVAGIGGLAAIRSSTAHAEGYGGWLNVKDYGAVGSGTTDDTSKSRRQSMQQPKQEEEWSTSRLART
jgi:hypothetical protein